MCIRTKPTTIILEGQSYYSKILPIQEPTSSSVQVLSQVYGPAYSISTLSPACNSVGTSQRLQKRKRLNTRPTKEFKKPRICTAISENDLKWEELHILASFLVEELTLLCSTVTSAMEPSTGASHGLLLPFTQAVPSLLDQMDELVGNGTTLTMLQMQHLLQLFEVTLENLFEENIRRLFRQLELHSQLMSSHFHLTELHTAFTIYRRASLRCTTKQP